MMKAFTTCALCATLAVPALVQTVAAEEAVSNAEDFVMTVVQLQASFAEVVDAMDEEKATPAEGAEAIMQITAALEQVKAALPKMSEADQAEIGKILSDEATIAQLEKIEAGCIVLLTAMKEAQYAGSEELQAACEAFAVACEYEIK